MALRSERGPSALSPLRTVALGIGFVCAITASVTIFVTDSAQTLRIGILVALWGFVFAALAAGRRQTEQAVAASAEIELRKTYELELASEVAARREYELRLEAQLRRELQDDFAAQVGSLQEEMIRLRHELSEQWDSELRVERMVMRTQSVRMGERREALEHAPANRASIDAAPLAASPLDATSWSPDEHRSEDRPGQMDFPAEPFEDGLGTREFPAAAAIPPAYPTAPVPLMAGMSNGPAAYSPPKPAYTPPAPAAQAAQATPSPAAAPWSATAYTPPVEDESEDVLARVLAEAGSPGGGRRRKHRYADEDE